MDEENTERKERWMKSLIANGDDRGLDAADYLVVIWALVSSVGTCIGFFQKVKEWVSALKRHYRGSGENILRQMLNVTNWKICAWAIS